jgi:protein MpaA
MSSGILHQSSWASTALGKSIDLFSAQNRNERPLLFIGGVHGDEPEGVELAQKFLDWLQKNNISSFHSWFLIPCLNLDGFLQNQRTNGHGVDLNRNFPSPDWSHESKAPRYFPGPHPASEPEVKALCSLIDQIRPQAIFHFHSWEPCVVYTGNSGRIWAEKASGNSGYVVREDIGYPTPGSLGQYGWLSCQIPVICIEEQEHTDLSHVWPHFAEGLQNVVRGS